MTTLKQTPAAGAASRAQRKGSILAGWLSSTDHKVIGHMYLITSFFFFLCAGIMDWSWQERARPGKRADRSDDDGVFSHGQQASPSQSSARKAVNAVPA